MQEKILLLKLVGVLVKLSRLKTFINKSRFLFSVVKLKSPRITKLSERTARLVNSLLE